MAAETYDQAAVRIMLTKSGLAQQAALDALMTQAAHERGDQCPDCGGHDIEDNGKRGVELTYLCTGCGHQWSPYDG